MTLKLIRPHILVLKITQLQDKYIYTYKSKLDKVQYVDMFNTCLHCA
jgi:hypothetical protein